MRMQLLLLGIISAAIGCATPAPVDRPRDRVVLEDEGRVIRAVNDQGQRRVIAAPFDSVWNALTSSLTMMKVELTTVNRPAGEQGNLKFTMSRNFFGRPVSHYFSCGNDPFGGANADAYPVTAALVAKIIPEGEGTAIETMLTGSTIKPGGSAARIYCASTGVLEQHLAEMVASRVR